MQIKCHSSVMHSSTILKRFFAFLSLYGWVRPVITESMPRSLLNPQSQHSAGPRMTLAAPGPSYIKPTVRAYLPLLEEDRGSSWYSWPLRSPTCCYESLAWWSLKTEIVFELLWHACLSVFRSDNCSHLVFVPRYTCSCRRHLIALLPFSIFWMVVSVKLL